MNRQSLGFIHLSIFLLFLCLLIFSIYQYTTYDTKNGTVLCSKNLNQCLLSVQNGDEQINKKLPFQTIGNDGLFQVNVCVGNDDFVVLGGNGQIFFGTPFRIFLYSFLVLFTFSSFYMIRQKFIPSL